MFEIPVDEFIEKIEKKLWTDEQIDKFCGFKSSNNNSESWFENTKVMIMAILLALVVIFLTTTIILSVKIDSLAKKSKDVESTISMVERHSLNE